MHGTGMDAGAAANDSAIAFAAIGPVHGFPRFEDAAW
jgi:hypothetical protein